MRIGELSRRAGASVQTLRFYEREKLLREPPRNSSGYRAYSDADLERVRFIKQSQELGFTLREVKQLLGIHDSGIGSDPAHATRWPDAFAIASRRLAELDKKITQLNLLRNRLAAGLEGSRLRNFSVCPASAKTRRAAPPSAKACPSRSA